MDFSKNSRFLVLIVVIILIGCAIVIQLFRLQIVSAKKYNSKALGQYVDSSGFVFERGTIYFTQKDGTLISGATVKTGYKVVVNPSIFRDGEKLYPLVQDYTKLSLEEFMVKVTKITDTHEEVANKLDEKIATEIKNMKFQGVTVSPESWRSYPGKNLASQVLGFVGFSNDNTLKGQYGLERHYNSVLSPDTHSKFINFFAEVFSNIDTAEKHTNTQIGDVVTTIEPTVQSYLESELHVLRDTWNSESVGAVIMDPQTGEIIALANMPDFDPNSFGLEKSPHVFTNPIIESVFEIGSVMKILTVAAGLDANVITPETTYNDTGIVKIDTESIYNAGRKKYGVVSIQEVLNKSLNTGAMFVMQKLGKEKFRNYFYGFGLKEKTHVDLPNEVSNLISNLESPRVVEYATASFGQGIALSPISAIRAFAVVANGGYLVTPHIVKKIQYADGTEKEIQYERGPQVLTKETTNTMSRVLTHVVDTALLNGTVKLKNHTAAAKTGTAQIADEQKGGYLENEYLHTMVSYFPAYDARFVLFIYNMKPEADDFSAKTLAPVSMEIGQFLMTYYNVPGDRNLKQ